MGWQREAGHRHITFQGKPNRRLIGGYHPPKKIYRYEIPHKIMGLGKWPNFPAWKNMASFLAIYSSNFREPKWEYVSGGRGRSFFGEKKKVHLNLESGFHKQLPKQLNTNFSYLERWKGSLSQKYLWHLLCPLQWWPFEKDANSARTSWSYLVFLTRCIDQKGGSSGHFLLAEFFYPPIRNRFVCGLPNLQNSKNPKFFSEQNGPGQKQNKNKGIFHGAPPSTPSTPSTRGFSGVFFPEKKMLTIFSPCWDL